MSTSTYTVEGMTCGCCAGKVTSAAAEVTGVENTDVDVATGRLTVTGEVDEAELRAAVDRAGYRLS